MLNRLKLALQDAAYRRLGIALVFSFVLHLLLIGKFYMSLPDFKEHSQVLEARLVLPTKSAKETTQKVRATPPVESTPQLKMPPDVEQATLPEPAPVSELPVSEPSALPDESIQESVLTNPVGQPSPGDAETDDQTEQAGLTVNPNPYQYVESEFDVYTDKETSLENSPAGKARIVYQRLPDADQYRIESLIQAKGLAALVIPDLLQTSNGDLNSSGLQPQRYLYQFGDKKNKTFTATFDWQAKKIKLQSENGVQQLDLAEGSQDLLSFMYQFMYVAPLQNMQLSITNGKKIAVYEYSFEGEEMINTKMGSLKTVHLVRVAAEGEKKTELWLASEYQYVPVKIRESGKDGKVYELLVKRIKTDMPAL
jgi:hypothetical protein